MKKLLTILLTMAFAFTALGQAKDDCSPNYDLAARFSPKKVGKMVFSTSVRPNWFKNSDKFWYSYKTPQGTQYYIVDPSTGSKREIFNMAQLAAQLTEIVKDPFDAQNIPIQKLALKDDKKFTFEIRSTAEIEKKDEKSGKPKKEKKVFGFEYDIATGKLSNIENYEQEKPYPRWANISPDKQYVVFSRNFNLYYMDMENLEKAVKNEDDSTIVEHQLTTEGIKDYGFGLGESDTNASEKEKNKRRGAYICWSPDSKHFAYIRSDYRKVKELWVIDVLAEPRPKLESYKYHMPGESEAPQRELYVYSMDNKSFKKIETKAFKDQELSILYKPTLQKEMNDKIQHAVWLGDNNQFYLYRVSRDLKRIDLCSASIQNDTVSPIIKERMNTYIEVRDPQLVNNSNEIIHWSEKSGWGHLYLYDNKGNLKNAITSGEFHVEEVLAVDNAQRVIYFTANAREKGENPYYTHQYRVNFDGSNLRIINPGNYNHESFCSDNGKYFVDNFSRVDTAPQTALYDNNGKLVANLEKADLSHLFAAGYKFPEPFTVKAGDGVTDLYGVMYKPFDFDSTKKYPIIEYVYPGPQTEAVNASWNRSMDRIDRLAQLGFIVITVGNRGGHPSRSKWYHNYGYGNLRDYGLEDKKVAAERLAARHSFIDINRVGIHGHSGGGFMSTAAMLVYPHFFKVAVSCAGNHENNIYNRWWSEKHHGVKEIVSEKGDTTFKYSIAKNSELAKNLRGNLLLITGDIDNNVHPGNTLRMVNALIRANKRFDMLVLPGQRHGFSDMNEYFFWKMADYFSEHLLGNSRKEVDIPHLNND